MDRTKQVNVAAADFCNALSESIAPQLRIIVDKWGLETEEAGHAMLIGLLQTAAATAVATAVPDGAANELAAELVETVSQWAERQRV